MRDYKEQVERIMSGVPPEIWDKPSEYWKGGGRPKYCQMDFETFCELDITKVGHYRYIRDKTFDPLLLAVAFDDEEPFIIDIASGDDVPDIVWAAIFDDGITKTAWNASFERTVFGVMAGMVLSPDAWKCTMVWAASLSLPLALKNAAAVLKTGEQKDRAGEALIRKFSVPRKPTKKDPRTRVEPSDDQTAWQQFKDYCLQDVRTERDIRKTLERFPMPDSEWDAYHMDQRINDRGVLIDRQLVNEAIIIDSMLSEEMTRRAYELSGLENPNSVSQLKTWLEDRGIEAPSLGKKEVEKLIKELEDSTDQEALDMMRLRLQMAKSSVKKYQAAERYMCDDDRARGLFQFNGANHTGRFCLAEGTPILVKTSDGAVLEKPIEAVAYDDMVFDGDEWVKHEGVVYSGDKDVITWDGITATEEHEVFVDDENKVTLSEAKEEGLLIWEGKQNPKHLKNDPERYASYMAEREASRRKTLDARKEVL